MRSSTLSVSQSRRSIRDFDYTLRKLKKCLHLYAADTGRCGLGIFTAKPWSEGESILVDLDGDYYEQVMCYKELTSLGIDIAITLQVGIDAYKLPTGSLEDFTNHSCDPNTGIRLTSRGTLIVALRNIEVHEELTYDYSTYLENPYEKMQCLCGSGICRSVVGNFEDLSDELKRKYLGLRIVGNFVAVSSLSTNCR
jgi:uncharacterized protein